jgi:hypothetical protein
VSGRGDVHEGFRPDGARDALCHEKDEKSGS